MLEDAMVTEVKEGSDSLIKFGPERKDAHRGFGGAEASTSVSIVNVRQQQDRPLIEKVAAECRAWLEKHADQMKTAKDKWNVVNQFVMARNLDRRQIAGFVGLSLETEKGSKDAPPPPDYGYQRCQKGR